MRWIVLSCVVGACGTVSSGSPDAATDAAKVIDAPPGTIDARTICDPTATFDAPVKVAGLSSSTLNQGTIRMMPDELTAYVSGNLLGNTDVDVYEVTRPSIGDAFGTPVRLSAVDSANNDWDPTISSDGLTIIFGSDRNSGHANDLMIATRSSTLAAFSTPALAGVNSATLSDDDTQAFLTADGAELWFVSDRAGGAGMHDVYVSEITSGTLGTPARVASLSSSSDDWMPTLSVDRLTIYVTSGASAPGTKGGLDIWSSHRASTSDPFPAPAPVGELNSSANDVATWLSADNCRLYLWSVRDGAPGGAQVYVAVRHP
jgi:hypothetical protein